MTAFSMPARCVSIAVSITNEVSCTGTDWDNKGIELLSGLTGTLAVNGAGVATATADAAADGSLSIVVQLSGAQNATSASVSRTVVLTAAFGANVKTSVDESTPTKLCQAAGAGCDDDIAPTNQFFDVTSNANVVNIVAITD